MRSNICRKEVKRKWAGRVERKGGVGGGDGRNLHRVTDEIFGGFTEGILTFELEKARAALEQGRGRKVTFS